MNILWMVVWQQVVLFYRYAAGFVCLTVFTIAVRLKSVRSSKLNEFQAKYLNSLQVWHAICTCTHELFAITASIEISFWVDVNLCVHVYLTTYVSITYRYSYCCYLLVSYGRRHWAFTVNKVCLSSIRFLAGRFSLAHLCFHCWATLTFTVGY